MDPAEFSFIARIPDIRFIVPNPIFMHSSKPNMKPGGFRLFVVLGGIPASAWWIRGALAIDRLPKVLAVTDNFIDWV